MALKVIIPHGLTEVTVNGLHQWDYGREIEIYADDLPAMVEVHFACAGMDTAVVRSCAVLGGTVVDGKVVGGKVTATIPNRCLEQTAPVVAWVYDAGETSGETLLTVKMPITQRTKPQPGATVPEEASDRYTEAIAEMAALVEDCEEIVRNTYKAIEADVASTYASKTDLVKGNILVKTAANATNATNDEHGENISETYARKDEKKVFSYSTDNQYSTIIESSTVFKLEKLPDGKTLDDIVGVGLCVRDRTPNKGRILRYSGGKSENATRNDSQNRSEVVFMLDAPVSGAPHKLFPLPVHSSAYARVILYVDEQDFVCVTIDECYHWTDAFDNQAHSHHASLEDGVFGLGSIVYWFA